MGFRAAPTLVEEGFFNQAPLAATMQRGSGMQQALEQQRYWDERRRARDEESRAAEERAAQQRIKQTQQMFEKPVEGFMRGAEFAQKAEAQRQAAETQRLQQQALAQQTQFQAQMQPLQERQAEAQIAGTQAQTGLQQAQLRAVQAQDEFLSQPAQTIDPMAPEGQTIEQYRMLAELRGETQKLEVIDANLRQINQQIGITEQLAPLERQQVMGQIQNLREARQNQRLNRAIAQNELNQSIFAQNVDQVAAKLSQYVDNPDAMAAEVSNLVQQGVDPAIVTKAQQVAHGAKMDARVQEQFFKSLEMSNPMVARAYKKQVEAYDKLDVYNATIAQLRALQKQVGTGPFDTPQEKDAINQIAANLEAVGMTEAAQSVRVNFDPSALGDAVSKKARIGNAIQFLGNMFKADVESPAMMPYVKQAPGFTQLISNINDAKTEQTLTSGGNQKVMGQFQNLRNVNLLSPMGGGATVGF